MVPKLGFQQGRRSCQIRYQVVQDLGLLLGLLRHVSLYYWYRMLADMIVSLGKRP